MVVKERVSLFELVLGLSDLLDFVCEDVINHHKHVAYIACSLANEMNLSRSEQNNLIIAAALHDLGAFSLQERLDALNFEVSFDLDNFCEHAEVGYLLLQKYEPFSEVAELIRYHHLYWVNKDLARFENGKLDLKSHFIHLADRIDVLIDKDEEILGQVKKIVAKIEEEAGIMFSPQLVEIFKNLAKNGDFWFELTSPSIKDILLARYTLDESGLDLDGLLILAQFFAQIVDIRSRFTATHSWGVAVVAAELGRFMGLSPKEVKMLKIAGYLHDLGKLAIPQEILNSSNSLTEDQYRLMKNHALYTYNALKEIKGLEIITDWASFHHERLDGKGYPFSYSAKDLNLGARIVAVADLFTATAEDRPYRKGMAKEEVLGIIEGLVEDGAVDGRVVSVLRDNYDWINSARKTVQEEADKTYQEFQEQVKGFKVKK